MRFGCRRLQVLRLDVLLLETLVDGLKRALASSDLVFVLTHKSLHLLRIFGIQKAEQVLDGLGGCEESLQPIEIALRDGIVFMIVAARASDGQPEKDLAGRGL